MPDVFYHNYWRVLIVIVLVGLSYVAVAQKKPLATRDSLFCATPELTSGEIRALEVQIKLALAIKKASGENKAGTITYVPIRPHIFRRANGTGGMTLNSLNNVLAITNKDYHDNGSGIQFYFCGTSPDYVDDDALFTSFPFANRSAVAGRDAMNAMNAYFVNMFDDPRYVGVANFPSNSIESTRSFIRTNRLSDQYLGSYVLNHELGHNFSLYHTFQGSNEASTPELVTRGAGANCTTVGDFLCDTPADPYGRNGVSTTIVNGCLVYTGTITDPSGEPYNPQLSNIMSYYDGCTPQFTAGQHGRIQGGLATRQTATGYTIDCAPTTVAAVSTLTATPGFSGGIVLNWQDNATNEMGYLIERSTTPTGVFVPVGGVGPNNNSFADLTTDSFITYSYRVRPSNSTTGGVSGVATATSGATLCRPTFTEGCYDQDGLDSFTLNGAVMSQNTGCTSGGYTQYSTPISVTAGQTVAIRGQFLGNTFYEGVTIWGDLNRDGIFESSPSSEQLFQTTGSLTTGFSGSLTIPIGTTAGALNIRVMVQFNAPPTNPCGTYSFGEAEDYVLQLGAICAAMFTTRAGNWTDPSVWSCNRVPTSTDLVEIRHVITVPASTTVLAQRVGYTLQGKIAFDPGGRLRVGL